MATNLTAEETKAWARFSKKITLPKRTTRKPVIVGLVGLVGSGKSSVAKVMAAYFPAAIIRSDSVREELLKTGAGLEAATAITLLTIEWALREGTNVIIDADCTEKNKRNKILDLAKKYQARTVFVQVTCTIDVVIGRILSVSSETSSIFNRASSVWKNVKTKGPTVRIRELWRRTPYHYRWVKNGGGHWTPKKPPFTIMAKIDTTNEKTWKKEIVQISKKLNSL